MSGGIGMLQIIIGCAIVALSFFIGRFIQKDKNDERLEKQRKLAEKHLYMFLLMNRWVQNKNANKEIADYLLKNGIHTVAIYGMNYIGETLYTELKNTPIEVEYAIDRNAETMYAECDMLEPDNELPFVDMIIVTPLTGFDAIKEMLKKKVDCKIISIEDIVYSL